MSNHEFIKTFDASGAIVAYSIVKATATDFAVAQATAATDKVLGVTTEIDAADTERVDVVISGTAFVKAGGTIAAGDPITANASGYAVTAAPAAGSNNRIIGFARQSAVSGDVFEVILSLGVIQG